MILSHLRRYPRTPVDLPIEYAWEGGRRRTRALTLGGGGLFLGILQPIAPGTELAVQMRPAKHLDLVQVRGMVRYWLPSHGIGLEFTKIKPGDRQMILRLIRHRMAEKRGFLRAPLAVQVGHQEGTFIGISRDISIGGMFIETNKPVSSDSNLKLRFNLDDGGPTVITAAAVRYAVEKLGIGVQFVDLLPADRGRIDMFVAKGDNGLRGPTQTANVSQLPS
jgi:c-di-GMP-binding flagellar brake protein YcgR